MLNFYSCEAMESNHASRERPAADARHARARPEPDTCETFDPHGTDRYLPRVEVPSTDF